MPDDEHLPEAKLPEDAPDLSDDSVELPVEAQAEPPGEAPVAAPGEAPAPAAPPCASESAPKLSRFERREKAAADALRTLIRDMYADRFMRADNSLEELDFSLSIKVDPRNDWALRFDPVFQEQLIRQLEDAEAGWGNWRDGSVYCFHCESNDCDCAQPPSMLAVFGGYDSMGTPQWCDFAQVLIDTRHESVDLLYRQRPPILHHLQYGKELKQHQLASYGKASKTYSILGQVVSGYFRVPQSIRLPEGTGNKVAVTFQVVETRDRTGHFKVALNTVVGKLDMEQRIEFFASENLDWLFRAREVALRSLAGITREAAAAREAQDTHRVNQVMRRVSGVLKVLGQSLERGDRQNKRRTKHAGMRKTQGDRPTEKALEDASKAGDDHFYFDEQKKTIVVAGPQGGRAHVFNFEGKHVTSFHIQQEAMLTRLNKKRWRYLDEPERAEFRVKLSALCGK